MIRYTALRLPLVLLQPNHDLRSNSAGPRIPVLQPVQHHRQDEQFHRTTSLAAHHRRHGQQQLAVLLPVQLERRQFLVPLLLPGPQEEPGGTGGVFAARGAADGEAKGVMFGFLCG